MASSISMTTHERVHVYHESIPHLDAEMSVKEFFTWADEVLGG